jgi:hypothetical protein
MVEALHDFVGENQMMAYLVMMAAAWWSFTAFLSLRAASICTATPRPATI